MEDEIASLSARNNSCFAILLTLTLVTPLLARTSSGRFPEERSLFPRIIFLILNSKRNGGTIPVIFNLRLKTKDPLVINSPFLERA